MLDNGVRTIYTQNAKDVEIDAALDVVNSFTPHGIVH